MREYACRCSAAATTARETPLPTPTRCQAAAAGRRPTAAQSRVAWRSVGGRGSIALWWWLSAAWSWPSCSVCWSSAGGRTGAALASVTFHAGVDVVKNNIVCRPVQGQPVAVFEVRGGGFSSIASCVRALSCHSSGSNEGQDRSDASLLQCGLLRALRAVQERNAEESAPGHAASTR